MEFDRHTQKLFVDVVGELASTPSLYPIHVPYYASVSETDKRNTTGVKVNPMSSFFIVDVFIFEIRF